MAVEDEETARGDEAEEPSSEQNQPADVEETKEASMSPKTSPKGSRANEGTTSILSPEHSSDDDFEMTVESEEHRQARTKKRNETATWKNMPKESTPEQRIDWPKVWLGKFSQQQEIIEEKAEQLKAFMDRPMKEDLNAALKLLGVPEWGDFFTCIDYMKQVDAARLKNFTKLLRMYSVDKQAHPQSEKRDPAGKDCSTPKLRDEAWTDRAQKFVNAKDICNAAAKWGCKELSLLDDGTYAWI
jgi:hypothetical protein